MGLGILPKRRSEAFLYYTKNGNGFIIFFFFLMGCVNSLSIFLNGPPLYYNRKWVMRQDFFLKGVIEPTSSIKRIANGIRRHYIVFRKWFMEFTFDVNISEMGLICTKFY